MPRPSHAQGRPETRVIPDDWNTTHAPVVNRSLRGRCALRDPATSQTWDGTEMVATPSAPYWTGPCRVQNLTATTKSTITVEDREFTADYLIVVPLGVAAVPDHLIELLPQPADVAGADAGMAGLVLQVEHVISGTERFELDLFCTLVR